MTDPGGLSIDEDLRILIFKCSATDIEFIGRELQKLSIRFSTKIANTKEAFLKNLEEFKPGLILSDYSPPYVEGMSVLSIARVNCPDTPFIFVAGSLAEETAIDTLRNGATDYVPKDKLSRLAPAVARALREVKEKKRSKELQERLDSERERLAVILGGISDGVVQIDSDRRIVLTNPTGEKYLKLLANVGLGDVIIDLAGQPIESILELPSDGQAYHELISEKQNQQVFEISARSIKSEFGADGAVILIRDVTAERIKRQRIERQERLSAVAQLAAGIAHNFNNTLTVIIGFSELLQRDPSLNDKARSHLDYIIQQGHRASQFVRQILDFTRQSVSERQPLDLSLLLREVSKQWIRTLPGHIRVIFDSSSGKYWVLADVSKMHQVLNNLVQNAVDAMPLGGELRVELDRLFLRPEMTKPFPQMQPGEWVVLSLSDNGAGIAPEHITRIFEPFFSTKEVGKGTGLGLAQVHGIVRQHEGFIDVISRVGKGTTFRIYLPAMEAKDIAQLKSPVYGADKLIRGNGEKILLVEDEKMVLETTKTMLEDLGYQVLTAIDGRRALKLYELARNEIALVITDMIMPEMDGTALFIALKEINPNIRVLVSTGYPQGEKTKELLAMGVLDCVEKPTDFVELSRVIGRALGKI